MSKKQSQKAYVTDHALLRYIERVLKLDVEAVRAGILTSERARMIEAGAQRIDAGTFVIVARGRAVTTVLPK